MNVDIHQGKRDAQEDSTAWVFPCNDGVFIRFFQCRLHQTALNITPIYEKVLHCAVGPGTVRFCEISPGGKLFPFIQRHLQHISNDFTSKDTENRCFQLPVARGRKSLLTVPDQHKRDFRMGKRRVLHDRKDISCFCKIFFQEFHPRRCVKKQVPDNDGCTVRAAGFFMLSDMPRIKMQVYPCKRPLLLGEQVDLGHSCNCRKGLPSETQCTNCRKVAFCAQFAGCMAFKRGDSIFRRHPAAVVCDPEVGYAAIFNFYCNAGCSRIDCVFYQLFCNRRWAFHNLPCRNQVCHMWGKLLNDCHKESSFPQGLI